MTEKLKIIPGGFGLHRRHDLNLADSASEVTWNHLTSQYGSDISGGMVTADLSKMVETIKLIRLEGGHVCVTEMAIERMADLGVEFEAATTPSLLAKIRSRTWATPK